MDTASHHEEMRSYWASYNAKEEAKLAWEKLLRDSYGKHVVEAKRHCFHCLAHGQMVFPWHKEAMSLRNPVPQFGWSLIDHVSLWRIGKHPLVYVSQPYTHGGESLTEKVPEFANYCSSIGLELVVDERATFYFPGHPTEILGITIWNIAVRDQYRIPD